MRQLQPAELDPVSQASLFPDSAGGCPGEGVPSIQRRCPRRRGRTRRPRARQNRAVHTKPQVAATRFRNGTAEASPKPACHRTLLRKLESDAVLVAEIANSLQHRWRAAGVDDGGGGVVACEHGREEVGDVALVTGVTVLAGELHIGAKAATRAEELGQAAGVLLVAEAEEDAKGNPS